MLLAGVSHLLRQVSHLRIIPPHQPLQFRKLTNHFRTQIGFADFRRSLSQISVRPHQRRDFAGQCCNPRHPFGLRAQFAVKGDIRKLFGHIRKGHPQVILPEKPRIAQARKQHFLVARQYRRAAIRRFAVGHGDEFLDPAAFSVLHAEKLLMASHGGLQNLRRQVGKIRRDVAHQRHRPFHQPGNFCQKRFVLNHFHALGKGQICGIRPNVIGAVACVQPHEGDCQFGLVVIKRGHRKPHRRHETMPCCAVTRRQTAHLKRHHLRAALIMQNTKNAVQRAHPAKAALPPAHGFWPRKPAQDLRHHLRHNIRRRLPLFVDHRKIDRSFFSLAQFQLFLGQPCRAQKPRNRLVRRVPARAFTVLGLVRRTGQNTRNRQTQPPWRKKRRRPAIGDPRLYQPFGHQTPQIIRRLGLHACRDFLAEQFKQQIGHGYLSAWGAQPAGAVSPEYAACPQSLNWCHTKAR